jgi:excisionase family DNA binding protein
MSEKRSQRTDSQLLSTKQLAQAIGVSESSVKRWADDGAVAAVRTVGGHRRIPLAEAIRFVRDTRATVVRPAALGLAAPPIARDGADPLADGLASGAAPDVRAMLHGLYIRGRSVAAIIDGPLRTAMQRIGERWRQEADGILVEHRATDLCIQWLNQLRALLVVDDEAPVAVGGAAPGDPYVLPSLAVATALEAEGIRAMNLGPDTPLDTLVLASRQEGAAIVWVSASTDAARDRLAGDLGSLIAATRDIGARLIVGGRALEARPLDTPADVQVAGTVAEAAAFARGLRAAPRPHAERST